MRKRTAFFVGAAGMRMATARVRTGCGNDRVTQEVRWGGQAEASAPTEGLQKAWLVVACRIRIHTHIRYIHPKPKPPDVFWRLMDELYKAHSDLKECAKYEPSALKLCTEIERLVLDLQEVI